MEVLRRKNPDQECVEGEGKFYVDMFENISNDVKKKMIICAADKADDPLDYCKLMIVFIKMFNQEIENYGEKLIETVNEAEIKLLGSNPDPLNQYRTILVTEILPTVLNFDRVRINSKLLLNNLYKAQEYILGCSLRRTSGGSWSILYNIVHCVAKILGWPPIPHVSVEATCIPVDTYLSILASSPTQMFHVTTCLVLHTVSEYMLASQDMIMVEAWVTHDSNLQERDKLKRRKTQDDPSASLPVLSGQVGSSGGDCSLVTLFQQAVTSWALITGEYTHILIADTCHISTFYRKHNVGISVPGSGVTIICQSWQNGSVQQLLY